MVTNHRVLKKTGKKRILRHKNSEQSLKPEFELYSNIILPSQTESYQLLNGRDSAIQTWKTKPASLKQSWIVQEGLSRKEKGELEKNCYQTK